MAQRECLKRGWLTYTDLNVLAQQKLLIETWNLVYDLVIHVSIACVTAYLASLVTLVGSAIFVSSLPWNNCRDLTVVRSSPSQLLTLTQEPNSTLNPNSELPVNEVILDLPIDESDLSIMNVQISNIASVEYVKDLAVVIPSRLPKPPFFMANETPHLLTFGLTDPISYLQKSYCTVVDSILRYRGIFYSQSKQCTNLLEY